ncbi:MAG: TonB-dependent receptor [Oceanicaulis sp.]
MLTATALAAGGAANAQVDVVTVTATKVESTTQDIPVAVSALDASTLDELNVDVFTDYLVQLPGVTAGGGGPGQNTIYIRGVASTTPNLTVAGVAGLSPNVAFYLDEQPLAQPGRNLDVYAVDLERVEVLPGPQGTLFGASSQAGTVRLITNKPVIGAYEAYANFGFAFTEDGEESYKTEAVVNLPFGDRFALRGVAFWDRQGGFIDNVPGTINTSQSARYRAAGTVRDNGVPVSSVREGFQAGQDLSRVTFVDADNAALVEEDFNDATYTGFRLAGRYEFNAEWRATVSVMSQELESDGVFFQDPDLDDWEISRFAEDELSDEFENYAWTLEGRVAELDVIYTGAYTDRTTEQTIDYTDYMLVGQYFPVYTCDSTVSYPGAAGQDGLVGTADDNDPFGTCHAPTSFVSSYTETTTESHEFRFNTPQTARFRVTAGAYYSKIEIAELNRYNYLGSIDRVNADGSVGLLALPANFPLTLPSATPGQVGNESDGYVSLAEPFAAGEAFRNDVLRTDEQVGIFGEATYDLVPETFSLTVGARYYDVEVDLEGSANSSYDVIYPATVGGVPVDAQAFGTNISRQFGPDGPAGAPQVAATDGVIFKVTGQWTPDANQLYYLTYSEGFRPGLLNRPGGAAGPGGYTVPYALDTDEVTNYEFGWKLDLLDQQLRFNGNVFFVDIEGLQTTIFDPAITNLFFSDNAANAEVMGVEGDLTYAPADLPGLTLSGAFSILDTEITEVLVPTGDVIQGAELAFAPGLQLNARARYEWGSYFGGALAHVQGTFVYSDESRSDVIEINAAPVEEYVLLGAATGLTADSWRVEFYVDNLANENAELSNNFYFDRERTTVARPRTWGVRFGVSY